MRGLTPGVAQRGAGSNWHPLSIEDRHDRDHLPRDDLEFAFPHPCWNAAPLVLKCTSIQVFISMLYSSRYKTPSW